MLQILWVGERKDVLVPEGKYVCKKGYRCVCGDFDVGVTKDWKILITGENSSAMELSRLESHGCAPGLDELIRYRGSTPVSYDVSYPVEL